MKSIFFDIVKPPERYYNNDMKAALLILASVALAGCGSVISAKVAETADRSVEIRMVQAAPASFKGTTVLWGGVILSTSNLESSTEIEVLETALSYNDVPDGEESRGRFIIRNPGYLDAEVFKTGKLVTVAGTVEGVEKRKIGRMEYPYPVVRAIEIKLSTPPGEIEHDYFPWWPYSPYPYGPGYPYTHPYPPYAPYPGPYYPYYPWPPPAE